MAQESELKPLSRDELIGKSDEVVNKHQQLLNRFGIESFAENTEFIATCPFCSGKFSMNKQTANWRCFHCSKSGNQYQFLRMIHPFWLEKTTDEHRLDLIKLRNGAIDMEELITWELAFCGATKEWMIPSRTEDGSLNQIYSWVDQYDHKTGDRFRQLMAAPSFTQMPFGLNRFRHSEHPVFILEGHWDFLAFWGLLRRTNQLHKFSCLGTPGTSFPQKWLHLLSGRPVITCFDNDKAGIEWTDRFAAILSRNIINVKSLHHIKWPEGLKKGFDVSDVITSLPQGFWKKN